VRLLLSSILLLLIASLGVAQDLAIKKVELQGENVIVHYDLLDSIAQRPYTVSLYSSLDNFINPLAQVTGDVGLEIKTGGNKKIIWNAAKELGAAFAGDVSLEVRGKIYIPFVKLDGFNDYKKFKRGKSYKVTWTGGRGNSVLNFDLYRGEKKVSSYPNIANVGQYNLTFEKSTRPGKDYKLKVSDSKNKDDVVYSEVFRIKRKTPLLIKTMGVAGVGFLLSKLLTGDVTPKDIVDPIKP
jgi:hypothetical protein